MQKTNYVVLAGQRVDHNNERVPAGESILLTKQEAEPLLARNVIALPEDAEKKDVLSARVSVADTESFKELTAAHASLLEQVGALQADVASKAKVIAETEAARLQAEDAAKVAAEAQIAAEAEVARLQAELKAATTKAPAKTESKTK